MPITRRKRANPADQPENTHQSADQTEGVVEQPLHSEPAPAPVVPEPAEQAEPLPAHVSEAPAPSEVRHRHAEAASVPAHPHAALPASNGDRASGEYMPGIEGGRRTARGELFRRPPQAPQQPQATFASPTPLQAPSHEITLPLGNVLHLAYNPGYTGSDEARSLLLHRLAEESKAGGRARCWNCGSLAVAYDRWSTRSRTFGDIGVAYCEICGVWSVL